MHGGLLGLAIGDAMGIARLRRARPQVSVHQRTWRMQLGDWSEPTSQAMLTAESLLEAGQVSPMDWFLRIRRYLSEGYWSARNRGYALDASTRAALEAFEQQLDRSAPVAAPPRLLGTPLPLVRGVIAGLRYAARPVEAAQCGQALCQLTHSDPHTIEATRYLAALVAGAAGGESRRVLARFPYQPTPDIWQGSMCIDLLAPAFERQPPRPCPSLRADHLLAITTQALSIAPTFQSLVDRTLDLQPSALAGALAGGLSGALLGARALPEALESQLAYRSSLLGVARRLTGIQPG